MLHKHFITKLNNLNKHFIRLSQDFPPQYEQSIFSTSFRCRCIDGKNLCGAVRNDPKLKHSKHHSPMDVVSLWCREMGLSFGQLQVPKKTNEITAVPKLIKGMNLDGCIVTGDAMNCQENIVKAILESKADFVLACKGNQEYLHETAQNIFAQREDNLSMTSTAQEWYHDYVSCMLQNTAFVWYARHEHCLTGESPE